MKKRSTTINEIARKILRITRDEYALCSYVQYRQADRRGRAGWCVDKKEDIAVFVGISRPGLYKMIDRLSKESLLFSEPKSGALQVTELWIDTENECKQSLQPSVNKVYTKTPETVNLVTHIYKCNKNKVKKEEEINIPFSENGKTVLALHAPDQIENTFVHVVESVSLETIFETSKSCSAGPGEIPVQSLTESEREDLLLLEQKSAAEATAFHKAISSKQTGKTGKTSPADRTAEICAELKTQEIIKFFHAIYPAAWAEWTDYKRRERKGTYKTAQTEAAAISKLATEVGFDPAAAKAAIQHSIAHTYMGIYLGNSAKTASAQVARYSLEDISIATTPDLLRDELSAFYNAHKQDGEGGLLAQAQSFAGTKLDAKSMKDTVTKFCCNRVQKGFGSESFARHHAALCQWLLGNRDREGVTGPITTFNTTPTRHNNPVVFAEISNDR